MQQRGAGRQHFQWPCNVEQVCLWYTVLRGSTEPLVFVKVHLSKNSKILFLLSLFNRGIAVAILIQFLNDSLIVKHSNIKTCNIYYS